MSTMTITASDVNKLRQITGIGMMDCKKALTEANGDFDKAIEILRKKGQKVAANREDKAATEGVVYAKASTDNKYGVAVVVNCETDFVAKNQSFIDFVVEIVDTAIAKQPADINELKELILPSSGHSIKDAIIDQIGKIGEKIELNTFEQIKAEKVITYVHPGNRLIAMLGFDKNISDEVAKDIAMQTAAMNPIAIDKDGVDPKILEQEIEIGKEQARQEGKPEEMLEKIAIGKLNKFYKEVTLLNQDFIKDPKKTVGQYLAEHDKSAKIIAMKRISI